MKLKDPFKQACKEILFVKNLQVKYIDGIVITRLDIGVETRCLQKYYKTKLFYIRFTPFVIKEANLIIPQRITQETDS